MEEPSEVDELPDEGVYVHGFFMDGARFNREEGVIDDQIPVSAINYKFLDLTLRQNAANLVQAIGELREKRRRVRLPMLQDWQTRGTAVYDRAVDQLYHPR